MSDSSIRDIHFKVKALDVLYAIDEARSEFYEIPGASQYIITSSDAIRSGYSGSWTGWWDVIIKYKKAVSNELPF